MPKEKFVKNDISVNVKANKNKKEKIWWLYLIFIRCMFKT